MIRYAPIIADTIPAFTNEIKIPFTHNSAVDWDNTVTGFSLRIKDMTNSEIIATINADKTELLNLAVFNLENAVFVDSTKRNLTVGQHYKFQIAYKDGNDISNYSTVAIGCYIKEAPEISINNLNEEGLNDNIEIYQGTYSHNVEEYSERLYQYRYDFYENNNVVQTSDWIFYKGEEALKPFTLLRDLDINDDYEIKFSIITVNGYENAIQYKIQKNENQPLIYDIHLNIYQDNTALENGYAELEVVFDSSESPFGTYEILRKPNSSRMWELFLEFDYTDNIKGKQHIWKDFTIAPGVEYVYGIRLKKSDRITDKILSDIFKPQFEYVFLSDEEKQLCICFNPKISNFKSMIMEQKIDTLGNKFPIFFKNPIKNAKEFTISGLISYHMDNENFFMKLEDKVDYEYGTTNLTNDNFALEKNFKLKVLEWLNNGKPKMFRSPAEGSYIVRLMNVSLTPNEWLGNMIHTFQAQAYECMELTQQNLKDNKLIFNNKIIRLENNSEFNNFTFNTNSLLEFTNISDIQYYNNTPSKFSTLTTTTQEGITKYFKVYDYYKFPENIVYASLSYSGENGATIYYKQHPVKNDIVVVAENDYWSKINNSTNQTISYEGRAIIENWLKYYTIIFTNNSDTLQEVKIINDKETSVYLKPKETKKYYELSGKYTFDIPIGVNAYVYGRK